MEFHLLKNLQQVIFAFVKSIFPGVSYIFHTGESKIMTEKCMDIKHLGGNFKYIAAKTKKISTDKES